MSRQARLLDAMEQDLLRDCAEQGELQHLLGSLRVGLLRRDALDIDRLNPLIEALLARLRERARRRAKMLQAVGLAAGDPGMRAFIASYPQPRRAQMLTRWNDLAAELAACHRLNEGNGRILATQQEILDQLLPSPPVDGLYHPSPY